MPHQRQVLNHAILFGLVGPAIVWAGACIYFAVGTSASNGTPVEWLSPYVAMLAILSLVSAYVAAIGPALLVGALFGWLRGRFELSSVAGAAVGFCLGFVVAFGATYALLKADQSLATPPATAGLIGGAAAFLCALVASRRMGANNSSKPTPLRGAA
jgi:hypothetical protein